MLLLVVRSEGSSPGRQGFRMAVADDGDLCETIGGGIMEHKLVELSRSILQTNDQHILLKKQYHDKTHKHNRSGMICSGMQWVVMVPITAKRYTSLVSFIKNDNISLEITPTGISKVTETDNRDTFRYNDDEKWSYLLSKVQKPVIHIIGGGHVGKALCQTMAMLNFHVINYDDRPDLFTMGQNDHAHQKIVLPYESLGNYLKQTQNDYLVIMTFGYMKDKIVLQQLTKHKFAYMGMMGSQAKTDQLFKEMLDEGVSPEFLNQIHAPIGINIASKTATEISISIAAEIIRVRNVGC